MVARSSDWAYLHAACHPSAGTWLRLGPNGAHVLECRACRKMITAFRVLSGEAENITHESGLSYEEAIEPFLDVVCHNCEAVFAFSPSVQLAVEAGWLQSGEKIWACPSCRSAAILDVLPDRTCPRCLEPLDGRRLTTVPGGSNPEELICVECAEAERNEIDMDADHQRHIDALDEIVTHPSPDVGGICGMSLGYGKGVSICRRDHGHEGGCDFEPV